MACVTGANRTLPRAARVQACARAFRFKRGVGAPPRVRFCPLLHRGLVALCGGSRAGAPERCLPWWHPCTSDADRAAWPRGAAAAVRRELCGATAPPAHLLCASTLQRRRPSPGALLARDGSAQLQQRQPAVRAKRRRRVPALRPRPARQRPARHRPLQRSGHARVLARGRRGGGRLEARGRAALGRRGAEGRRAALRPLGADRAHLAQPARAADRERRVARRGAHLVRVRVRVRVS